ncbi:MAG: hypothetical protein CML07_08175 [Psychrobacter sp.]|jgi:hypothetical protein|nr:hypothetical protein [Psychrobacter sp.]
MSAISNLAQETNYASWPPHVGRHIDVADRKQLFLDDGFLIERAEGIRYVLHQPVKCADNPLIVPDRPWEQQVQLYGSVLWDEERTLYRMWYTARTHRHGKDGAVVMAYAESADGVTWEKPALGLADWEGSTDNNLLLDPGPGSSGGVCVLHTP